ncbi:hypothetical protein D9M72_439900 [compost metagenome]
MADGRFVEGRRHHFAAHRALHLGHFFRALIDQQHEQVGFRMVVGDRVRDVLQHHGLAGLGRGHQQRALAAADRRDHVDDAAGDVLFRLDVAFERERPVGVQRRQVLEHDAVLDRFGRLPVDLVHLDQCKVAFAVLGRTHFTLDRIAGVQVETADLGRADIDVIRAGQIRGFGRAQEAEAVGQHLQRAVSKDGFAHLGALLQDRKHQFLFAHPLCVVDLERSRHFEKRRHVKRFEFCQVHRRGVQICPDGRD